MASPVSVNVGEYVSYIVTKKSSTGVKFLMVKREKPGLLSDGTEDEKFCFRVTVLKCRKCMYVVYFLALRKLGKEGNSELQRCHFTF